MSGQNQNVELLNDDEEEDPILDPLLEKLRPFQREAYDFATKGISSTRQWSNKMRTSAPMIFDRKYIGKGRILLADEMGLGKTVTSLAIMAHYRRQDEWPLLILCPASLRYTWPGEIEKFIPSLPASAIYVVQGFDDADFFDNPTKRKQIQIVIATYSLLQNRSAAARTLRQFDFQCIIVDESHNLKQKNSQRTKLALPLLQSAKRLVLLSGTPALARPVELWTQLSVLAPDLFGGTYSQFTSRYCNARRGRFGWDVNGLSNPEELHQKLRQIMVRRLKSDVLTELPAKQRSMVPMTIPKDKRKECESIMTALTETRKSVTELLSGSTDGNSNSGGGSGGGNNDAFGAHLEARQLLMQAYQVSGIAKANAVCDYVLEWLRGSGSQKVLLFAHHKGVLDALESTVSKELKGAGHIRIDGTVPAAERAIRVRKFQTSKQIRVAVLSVTAAGVGLTLTAATTVMFAELHWTPGVLAQAEDRCHRMGQQNAVNVLYLVCRDDTVSVDMQLWNMLGRKIGTLGKVVDGTMDASLNADVAEEGDENGGGINAATGGGISVQDELQNFFAETATDTVPEKPKVPVKGTIMSFFQKQKKIQAESDETTTTKQKKETLSTNCGVASIPAAGSVDSCFVEQSPSPIKKQKQAHVHVSPRTKKVTSSSSSATASSSLFFSPKLNKERVKWSCEACTFENCRIPPKSGWLQCEICHTPHVKKIFEMVDDEANEKKGGEKFTIDVDGGHKVNSEDNVSISTVSQNINNSSSTHATVSPPVSSRKTSSRQSKETDHRCEADDDDDDDDAVQVLTVRDSTRKPKSREPKRRHHRASSSSSSSPLASTLPSSATLSTATSDLIIIEDDNQQEEAKSPRNNSNSGDGDAVVGTKAARPISLLDDHDSPIAKTKKNKKKRRRARNDDDDDNDNADDDDLIVVDCTSTSRSPSQSPPPAKRRKVSRTKRKSNASRTICLDDTTTSSFSSTSTCKGSIINKTNQKEKLRKNDKKPVTDHQINSKTSSSSSSSSSPLLNFSVSKHSERVTIHYCVKERYDNDNNNKKEENEKTTKKNSFVNFSIEDVLSEETSDQLLEAKVHRKTTMTMKKSSSSSSSSSYNQNHVGRIIFNVDAIQQIISRLDKKELLKQNNDENDKNNDNDNDKNNNNDNHLQQKQKQKRTQQQLQTQRRRTLQSEIEQFVDNYLNLREIEKKFLKESYDSYGGENLKQTILFRKMIIDNDNNQQQMQMQKQNRSTYNDASVNSSGRSNNNDNSNNKISTERYSGGAKERARENVNNGTASSIDMEILEGRLCAWCGGNLPTVAIQDGVECTYCSRECTEQGRLKRGGMYASKQIRSMLYALEGGVCRKCNIDAHALYTRIRSLHPAERLNALINANWNLPKTSKSLERLLNNPKEGDFWQADHIVPVAEGGGNCELDNLQTLCVPCHQTETEKLRSRLKLTGGALSQKSDEDGTELHRQTDIRTMFTSKTKKAK